MMDALGLGSLDSLLLATVAVISERVSPRRGWSGSSRSHVLLYLAWLLKVEK